VKHLEQHAGASGGRVQQGNDSLLVGWALRQGIIERNGRVGGFRLCVAGGVSQSIIEEEDEYKYMEGNEEWELVLCDVLKFEIDSIKIRIALELDFNKV
jgi:hypothetical protein